MKTTQWIGIAVTVAGLVLLAMAMARHPHDFRTLVASCMVVAIGSIAARGFRRPRQMGR
ncbi:MAG: hypothetical protein SFU83_12665 [Meiothermus sp.]|nr:hypothetical protein [Meiothermus sp.]